MARIPQVVDHVNIPVIVAGGVMDSRGWLASHALGAKALIQHLREEGPAVLPYPIQNDLTKQIRAAAGKAGLTKWMHMWSGQGVRLAQDHDAATFFKQLIQNTQSQAKQFNM